MAQKSVRITYCADLFGKKKMPILFCLSLEKKSLLMMSTTHVYLAVI